jgi:hypothetical protein
MIAHAVSGTVQVDAARLGQCSGVSLERLALAVVAPAATEPILVVALTGLGLGRLVPAAVAIPLEASPEHSRRGKEDHKEDERDHRLPTEARRNHGRRLGAPP